ncbi:hypothetical protein [Labrenzia sp. R5_0]|jgi:hypothetical protein|uniref:hypothetical protein n=1 Tax=Stappiaceae TaxID=2821832 RepID=UPI001ADD1762|nr:hypothetical protein [Labrenzia sp. R5_0]MBO9458095.1 hypothetical protein [Labrenzia sp. R5_0]
MPLVLYLIRAIFVLLIAVFGLTAVIAAQGDWSRADYPVSAQNLTVQSLNLAFAARAPPSDGEKVAVTGRLFEGTGYVRVLDGARTGKSVSAFAHSSTAPNRVTNGLPDNPSQLGHVFGDRPGHLPDTPQNRQLLVDTSNNPSNLHGTDRFGNEVHTITQADGSQVWVYTRNGVIQNGGVNNPPKQWVEGVGLQ